MKRIIPASIAIGCAALLAGCGPKQSDTTQQQEQAIQQQQAREQRELHEREAALDEKQRVLEQREQGGLTVAPENAQPLPVQAPPQQPAPAQAPADNGPAVDVTYQQFYDNLTPFGSWIQMAGYGYVWQPHSTVQDSHWRPYTLGRWAYTDDGWTWVSDEPFGWITYHYGRWMRTHTEGWVWVPGDQWAPAWVAWRYGNDFVGWAPLPPEARFDGAAGIQQWADQQYSLGSSDYVFVPASAFGDTSMLADAVPPDQVQPIYDESTNVTNIYETGGVIYCYGPAYDFLRGKSRGKFPAPMKIGRVAYNNSGTNGVFESNGTLSFTAPRVVASRRAEEPKKVRDTGVVDARIVSVTSTPPPHGAPMPPLYHPPQIAKANAARQAQQQQQGQLPQQAPPPLPAAAVENTQNGRDQQIIQRSQNADEERRRPEEAQQQQAQAAQQQQQSDQQRTADEAARNQRAAEETARNQRAADEAARQQAAQQQQQEAAVREQAAHEESARQQEAARAAQNAPTNQPIPGRQQQ